jgi:glutamine cyclotransferase
MRTPTILIIFCLFCLSNCIGNITIESSQPHNKNCYTQGIFFLNSTHLFESCGLYGKSYFHVMEYQSKPFEIR